MSIGGNIKALREHSNMTQDEFAKTVAKVTYQAVSTWERGERDPRMGVIERISSYYNIPKSVLLDGTPSDVLRHVQAGGTMPDNLLPLHRRMIPVLGNVSAGQPIWADEERDEYVDDNGATSADFALRVKGDSMAPLIQDGDFVFVRQQPDVRDGEIAVVLSDDSATLKVVYHQPRGLQLVSINPAYPPMIFDRSTSNELRILGLAISFKRSLLRK